MKKNLRYFMTLLLMMVASAGWAEESVFYTLDGTITDGGNSNYAQDGGGLTQNGIGWSVTGNTTINPWRIGGKNLTNEDREAYSKTAMGSAISKVELEVGAITLTSVNSIKLIVASNSDFTTVLQTIEKTGITANTTLTFNPTSSEWEEGAYYKFVFNVTAGGSNSYIQLKSAKFYKNEVVAVEAPTFSVAEGTYASTQSVELSCVTEGATIYYTTDGTEPTAESTLYTGAISISETTTLKAIAVKGEDVSSVASATYTIVNIEHAGTEADPYTVADARNAIDTNTGIEGVYATGIVSKVDSYNSNYHSITYWISADGTTTSDQLEVYSGKGIGGADFESKDDIQLGDEVTVYGNLTKYNTTYEFALNNQLVSLKRTEKDEAGLAYETTEYTINSGESFTAPTLTNPNGLTVSYDSSNKNVATVANDGTVTIEGVGTTTITASFAGNDQYKAGEASYTLTVKSNYTIVDGVFDFTQGEDYGSGLTPSDDSNYYITENHTWTAGNVTLVTSGKYRWWSNDGTLRVFAPDTDNTTLTLSVPEGNVITKIVVTGGSNYTTLNVDKGTYTDGTWTGSAQTVVFSRGTANAQIKTITVTYGNGTEKEDVTMEFSATSATATLGEDFTAPTLTTTPSGIDVTYSSSDENVATVAADGTVTLVAAGKTKITASFAGDETYNAGEASYMLTVKEKEAEKTLVTIDADGNVTFDLTDNAWGFPTDGTNNDEASFSNSGYTIKVAATTNYKYYSSNGGYFLLGQTDSYLTLPAFDFDVEKIEVVGRSGASGSVKQTIFVGDKSVSNETTGATGTNVYEIDADNQAAGNIYTLKVTSKHNTQITSIKVYKKQDVPANITISPAKEYTTLTSAYALDFSAVDGLAAYIVEDDDVSDGNITLTQVSKVPAKTGLVLQKTGTASSYDVPTFDGTGADDVSNNKMVGSATETTDIAENAGYILKDGKFSPSAAGTLPAGKAYLAVAVPTTGAKDLAIVFGEGTGINNVNVNENESGKIFNLAGQQMKSAVKGVYIKNGKKYIK